MRNWSDPFEILQAHFFSSTQRIIKFSEVARLPGQFPCLLSLQFQVDLAILVDQRSQFMAHIQVEVRHADNSRFQKWSIL